MNDRTYKFAKSSLTLRFGDITSSNADVVVSSDDSYITMGGGVSAAIRRAGGQEIILDAAKKVPAHLGDVVVTTAGRLHAKYIFHAITIGSGSEKLQSQAVIGKVVMRCFDLLDLLCLCSIAFPAIGAGVAGFSYEEVAVEMANLIASRLSTTTRPLDVTIFLFDRFGQMQPIDFVRFFEEFRARVPEVASHETKSHEATGTRRTAPKRTPTKSSDEPIPRRRRLVLSFDQITNERSQVEEQLARLVASGNSKQLATIRRRLDKIQNERLRLLARLEESSGQSISAFVSYAHEDKRFKASLEKQLSILKRQKLIAIWHDREITAGSEWSGEISDHLNKAELILLLISPDFVASDYCYDIEMKRALERHDAGEARVIPIILRSVMWSDTPFAKLQVLPADGKPINTWGDRDAAFLDVAEGIRAAISSMNAKTEIGRK